jgi:hypothetical protein
MALAKPGDNSVRPGRLGVCPPSSPRRGVTLVVVRLADLARGFCPSIDPGCSPSEIIVKPLISSGLDGNPLLAFQSEDSAQAFSDDSVEGSSFRTDASLSRPTRPKRANVIHRWLDGESKPRAAFDVFIGLAAAVGLGLALQETSRSFDRPLRRPVTQAAITPATGVDWWLESHPVASFEPFRIPVPTDTTIDVVNAIEFDHCDIDVQGARAVASCQGSARYVPAIGNRNPPPAYFNIGSTSSRSTTPG